MTAERGRQAGFTLLEVLIVLGISGLLLTGIAAGLRLGLAAWRQAERLETRADRLAAAREAVRRALGATRAEFASADRLDHRLDFEGGAQVVRFTAALPAALGHDLTARQVLFLARGNGMRKALVLGWDFPFPRNDAPPDDTILLDDVGEVGFRYWGQLDGEKAPAWHDRWGGQTRLPLLVHIEVSRADDAPMVVDARIPANTSPFCDYNPVTLGCDRP